MAIFSDKFRFLVHWSARPGASYSGRLDAAAWGTETLETSEEFEENGPAGRDRLIPLELSVRRSRVRFPWEARGRTSGTDSRREVRGRCPREDFVGNFHA